MENRPFFVFFSKTKRKTAKKNAAQCISSNLKATSKNSGTFENTQKRLIFHLALSSIKPFYLISRECKESYFLLTNNTHCVLPRNVQCPSPLEFPTCTEAIFFTVIQVFLYTYLFMEFPIPSVVRGGVDREWI